MLQQYGHFQTQSSSSSRSGRDTTMAMAANSTATGQSKLWTNWTGRRAGFHNAYRWHQTVAALEGLKGSVFAPMVQTGPALTDFSMPNSDMLMNGAETLDEGLTKPMGGMTCTKGSL